jgi:hypothetical protein
MRTESRRKAKKKPEPPSEPQAQTAEPAPAEPVVETTSTERLTVPLRDDGTIDLDAMRARTKEKLKTAVADGRLRERLGLGGGPSVADDPQARAVFEGAVGQLYAALSRAVQYGVLKRGASIAQVRAVGLTPDEIAGLAPVTVSVIEKWLPDGLKWQEEITLALALSGVIMAKVAAYEQAGAQPQPQPEAPAS